MTAAASDGGVTVVIPNHNGRALLARCLAELDRQTLRPARTVVVDNASSDDSVGYVRESFPAVDVVPLPENVGFARAVNAGAARADSEFVAFLNSDAEPDPPWLDEAVRCARRHPGAASIACRVERADDRRLLDGAGDSMTRSLKAYRRGFGEPGADRFVTEEQVFAASGTACLWRADVFRSLGGFDESFFAYYEDVDLGARARLAGYECWYAPGSVVAHVGGATAAASWDELEGYHSTSNRWATIVKTIPLAFLVRNAHLVLAGELLAIGGAVARRRLRHRLRGYARFAAVLPALLRQRTELVGRAGPGGRTNLVAHIHGAFPPVRTTAARYRRPIGDGRKPDPPKATRLQA